MAPLLNPIAAPISITPSPVAPTVAETRGYLVSHSKDFNLESIRAEVELAARAGFNLIIFPVYINGYTLFPSESAREIGFNEINPLFKKWNPLGSVAEIAGELGLSVWGFARPWNFHPRHSVAPHRLLKKFPAWRAEIHPDHAGGRYRKRINYTACPLNPEYRRYVGNVLTEMVTGYPIEGIVINLSGYALRDGTAAEHPFCFCESCRATYAEATGCDLVQDARSDEKIVAVREWQTEGSTHTLEHLRHRIMKSRRTTRLVCRAQPQWRWNAEDAGPAIYQRYCLNWRDLLSAGIVEELIIDHDEEVDPEIFSCRLVSDLTELHHETLILPSVRIERPEQLGPPLEAIRRYPACGFVAEFEDPLTEERADFIREQYLAEPARLPEREPLLAVALLLQRVQADHAANPLLKSLMRDFLRLVERAWKEGASFQLLEMLFENLRGLQEAIRRGRLGDYHVSESTLRDIGLARRMIRLASLDVRS